MQRSVIDFTEREKHRPIYDLHIDLLKLRREDPVFSLQRSEALETAMLNPDCLALRYSGNDDDTRLVLANFGPDLHLKILSQPLLAPPPGCKWKVLWHSSAVQYGGPGFGPIESEEGWLVAGESTIALSPVSDDENSVAISQDSENS